MYYVHLVFLCNASIIFTQILKLFDKNVTLHRKNIFKQDFGIHFILLPLIPKFGRSQNNF